MRYAASALPSFTRRTADRRFWLLRSERRHPSTPILGSYPVFRPGGNTAAEQEQQVGMHHDGMHYFALHSGRRGSEHGLMVVNHEYTDEGYLHTGTSTTPDQSAWTAEMVRKSQAAHGVSIVEVEQEAPGNGWWFVAA